MTSSYNEIFSRFLLKVTDYSFAMNSHDTTQEFMCGWLKSAIAKTYLRRIFKEFEYDDKIMNITFSLVYSSGDENADEEYVLELLSTAMVVEWLEPKVNSTLNISQMFGGKEEKFYSQSQHLATLHSLLNDSRIKVRKMIRDHGYIYNSYIGDYNVT